MEQGNMLLSAASDSNDRIRDANAVKLKEWKNTKNTDEMEREGKAWFHGTTDVMGTHHFISSAYDTSQRMKNLGKSYGGLAQSDISDAGKGLSELGQSGLKSAGKSIQSIGDGVGAAKDVVSGVLKGTPPPKMPVMTVAGGKASGEGFVGVQSSADLTEAQKTAAATGKFGTAAATSTDDVVADLSGKTAGGTKAGGLVEKGVAALTGAEVGSAMNIGIGKVFGNVGGAVDIFKDFENIGKKGGFLGGTGSTTGDEIGDALTIGGTALDLASIALPFLAPVAAAVQLGGAAVGTYESIHDADKKEKDDKGDYGKSLTNLVVAPSLAGSGFLASSQANPMKMMTGTTAF